MINIVPKAECLMLHPQIYTAPKMWMSNFLIEMEKVNQHKILRSNSGFYD